MVVIISSARVEIGQLWTNQMMAEETGGASDQNP